MFVYTALGDSITFGQNARSVEKSFPRLLQCMLNSQGLTAVSLVLARPGWTTAELSGALNDHADLIRRANAVSIWIGGDDLIQAGIGVLLGSGGTIQEMIRGYENRLAAILRFSRKYGPRKIVCCTQYNPFPNSPVAVDGIRALNKVIISTASKMGCRVARPDQWFAGGESQFIDGYKNGVIEEALTGRPAVHPNDEGHALIASGLFPFIYQG